MEDGEGYEVDVDYLFLCVSSCRAAARAPVPRANRPAAAATGRRPKAHPPGCRPQVPRMLPPLHFTFLLLSTAPLSFLHFPPPSLFPTSQPEPFMCPVRSQVPLGPCWPHLRPLSSIPLHIYCHLRISLSLCWLLGDQSQACPHLHLAHLCLPLGHHVQTAHLLLALQRFHLVCDPLPPFPRSPNPHYHSHQQPSSLHVFLWWGRRHVGQNANSSGSYFRLALLQKPGHFQNEIRKFIGFGDFLLVPILKNSHIWPKPCRKIAFSYSFGASIFL